METRSFTPVTIRSMFKESARRLLPVSIIIIIGLCLCSFPSLIYADQHYRILIVSNSNEEPYRLALDGFMRQLAGSVKAEFSELKLTQIQAEPGDELTHIHPDIIFTLGSEALNWATRQTSRIPIVATMVLKEEAFNHANNVTGVILSYSMQTQIQWLKKFFPQQSTVAILYNPAENAGTVREASQLSRQAGLNLITIPVLTHKELPYALEQLEKNVELLFAIPDETVMSAATAKEVLLASFRNKVPLIGLSDNWVKSGAFYALSWDYNDLGSQCAAQAEKILKGTPVSKVMPEHPRKQTYTVNVKIAEHMNIEISNELLKKSKNVFN